MIKAIETRYAGYRFRSRLEARWAVFFNRAGIEWQYEPQGFEIHSGPDRPVYRYLPDFYLPGSGTWVEVKGNFSDVNWDMIANAVDWQESLPGMSESVGTTRGLLILGEVPKTHLGLPVHPILQHHKGGGIKLASFTPGGLVVTKFDAGPDDYFDSTWAIADAEDAWVKTILKYAPGKHCNGREYASPLLSAYEAARSARFEHGERG